MPSPRKRHFRAQVGRVLAKGNANSTESDFSASELENLYAIGAYGHDGASGFTHAASGSAKQLGQGDLSEDAGLETIAEVNARTATSNWHEKVRRYYLSSDTTREGMTSANPATATEGILHCPAGPDAKLVPNLEDVSNGSQIDFYIRPQEDPDNAASSWASGKNLVFFTEAGADGEGAGTEGIRICQGDSLSTQPAQWDNGAGAGTTVSVDWSNSLNNTLGVVIRIDNDSTSIVDHKGWQVAWEVTTD
jgi:hypothetical protein